MKNIDLNSAQHEVIDLFNKIYPISDGLAHEIRKSSRIRSFKRKDHLLQLNQVNRSIYFILQGCVRTYYIDDQAEEHTSWLLAEGDLAISVYSFFSQQKSFEAMVALEDCITLELNQDTLTAFYAKHLGFNFIGRYLTEQYYIRSEKKANSLRMLNARQRYVAFLEERPELLQRVSLGHIASYLGITQSTLSRIRATL